jgi:hypothetical protein
MLKVRQLCGEHVGCYVRVGNRAAEPGRSFEVAGMLDDVRHQRQGASRGGTRTKTLLRMLVLASDEEQHLELTLHPETDIEVEDGLEYPQDARDAGDYPLHAR